MRGAAVSACSRPAARNGSPGPARSPSPAGRRAGRRSICPRRLSQAEGLRQVYYRAYDRALADVAGHYDQPDALVLAEELDPELQVHAPFGLMEQDHLEAIPFPLVAQEALAQLLPRGSPILRGYQLEEGRQLRQLRRVVAADFAKGLVGVDDAPFFYDDEPLPTALWASSRASSKASYRSICRRISSSARPVPRVASVSYFEPGFGPFSGSNSELASRGHVFQGLDARGAELLAALLLQDSQDVFDRQGRTIGPVLREGIEDVRDRHDAGW